MKREIIMISLIITLVIVGHVFTQKHTQDFFEEIEKDLSELKEQALGINKNIVETNSESNNSNDLIEKIKNIREKWNNKYDKLAYYTEHDELEKIGAELVVINGYFEGKEYENGTAEIDRVIYFLQKTRDKDNFKLVNIF